MSDSQSQHGQTIRSAVRKSARKQRLRFWHTIGVRVVFFLALLALWQLLSAAQLFDEMLFPSPAAVVAVLVDYFRDLTYVYAIAASMKRLALGYGLALVIGLPLGLLLGRVRLLDDTVGTLALGLQALPSICWLPLAVLWFGLSEAAMLFVVVMGSLMALTQAVRDGVKRIPRLYLRASRVMGATTWKSYVYVILPASLPAILTGAKLGWSFAWRSLMAAELLYVNVGLGSTLTAGRELHDMGVVVATMLVIVAIGLVVDRLIFGTMEKVVHRRWGTGAA